MEQVNVKPETMARATDPQTSHDAAADARKNMRDKHRLVLKKLFARSMTDFELAEQTGLQQTSIGKRRGECAERGWVQATGERRRTPSGSSAAVWEITEQGKKELTQ